MSVILTDKLARLLMGSFGVELVWTAEYSLVWYMKPLALVGSFGVGVVWTAGWSLGARIAS